MIDESQMAEYLLWLRSVQAGQKVAIERYHNGRGRVYDVLEVSRVTPSMLVCDITEKYARRFDRKTGKEKGVDRRWYEIQPITSEIVEANELRNLGYWWSTVAEKNKDLDLCALRAIKAAVDRAIWEAKEAA